MREGNTSNRNAVFLVAMPTAASQDVSVSYETIDGTAQANSDYQPTTGTLIFAPDETSKPVAIPIVGDRIGEPDETFEVVLTDPSGAVLDRARAQCTIEGDDKLVDFNRDGEKDILWQHQAGGELYAWMLQGTVTTAGSYLTPKSFSDTNWQIRGLADFDRDGKVDVLWHHRLTGDLYVWSLDGTVTTAGSYLTPKSFSDTRWQIRAVGDFDGDHQPDILWHHQVTGDLYVWYLNGTVTVAGSYLTPKSFADTRWQIRRVVDLNGDDKPDVLWHHQVTGDLYVWFLDGTVTTSGSYLTPKSFTDTRWQIVPR